ncbi:hypothetical protein BDV12DRAFT_203646 [Aspergillus spectabilis]
MFGRATGLTLLTGLLALAPVNASSSCRCMPGDACWPSPAAWSRFNQTIDGRLIATVPLGTPCHGSAYNVTECDALRAEWTLPELHFETSSSIMAPFFANGSCDPFHPVNKTCTLDNYIVYAVNVSKPDHVSKAIRFATTHNIRSVVRNTGHDYNGKSTGAGALGIWTHNLKNIEIKNWTDSRYKGKAIKLGAGVQGIEAYMAAEAQGLEVVGGECPTVGIAGGYTQGGGHSALASVHGLAADQVLQWEIIDGNGNFITATRDNKYSDLFWALSGGGGGTYGVVWSMTSKAHPGTPVSGLNLTFTNAGISQDIFYDAVTLSHCSHHTFALGDSSIVFTFVLSFGCRPVAKQWDPSIAGTCINTVASYYGLAGTSLAFDVIIIALPLPILLRLQLKLRQKILLGLLFSLGFFVTIIQIIRIFTVKKLETYTDSQPIIIWSIVEISLGVIISCIPTYGPLFRALRINLSSYRRRATQTTGQAYRLSSTNMKSGSRVCDHSVPITGVARSRTILGDNDSEKSILAERDSGEQMQKEGMGIHIATEVRVERGPRASQ